MSDPLLDLPYGGLAGGAVALDLRAVEKYWVSEVVEARKKFRFYARTIGMECRESEMKLTKIKARVLGQIGKLLEKKGLLPKRTEEEGPPGDESVAESTAARPEEAAQRDCSIGEGCSKLAPRRLCP